MIRYSRWAGKSGAPEVESHVRAHLSSVADPDDNPTTYADLVQITREDRDDAVLIVGELDADPIAPYLRAGFRPEDDVAANPLTVQSMGEGR